MKEDILSYTQSIWESHFENEECFHLFNPKTKKEYDYIVDNWSKAIIYMLNNIK